MSWTLSTASRIDKALAKLPGKDYRSIRVGMDELAQDPYHGDLQKLGGIAWRKRIGNYRIKFELHVNERVIHIYHIERRVTNTYRKR